MNKNENYQILNKIGEGSYGIVFKVFNKQNNIYEAMKKIKP